MRPLQPGLRLFVPWLGCISMAAAAYADPISIQFEVTVRLVQGDMHGVFGAPVAPGDVLRGSFSYDPAAAAPDANPDPLYGAYALPGQLALHHGVGIQGPIGAIHAIDDRWGIGYPSDYLAAVAEGFPIPGFSQTMISAEFYGAPANQTGAPLPQSAASFLALYDLPGAFRFSANQNGVEPPWDDTTHALFGTIGALDASPDPVPEPGTWLLAATGALTALRRRRNSAGKRAPLHAENGTPAV